MSKFEIKYVVQSPDLNEATKLAHEILFKADVDADSVDVRPEGHPAGLGFGEKIHKEGMKVQIGIEKTGHLNMTERKLPGYI